MGWIERLVDDFVASDIRPRQSHRWSSAVIEAARLADIAEATLRTRGRRKVKVGTWG
jgi:hypothetical protein